MKQETVKRSTIFVLFIGVFLVADLVPAPGLGRGVIQTLTQGLNQSGGQNRSPEQGSDPMILNGQNLSTRPEETTQNYILPSTRYGG